MAVITQILTSDDDDEIIDSLSMLLSSTNGLGMFIPQQESIHALC